MAFTMKQNEYTKMENVVKWHHGAPDDGQFVQAIEGLDAAFEAVR